MNLHDWCLPRRKSWILEQLGVSSTQLDQWRNGTTTPSAERQKQIEELTEGQVPASSWRNTLVFAHLPGCSVVHKAPHGYVVIVRGRPWLFHESWEPYTGTLGDILPSIPVSSMPGAEAARNLMKL